jgi:aldose 1-epimerase
VLIAGGYTAEVSVRGAAVRALAHHGRELITSWPEGGPVPHHAGTILAPWPNRVAAGRYVFDGETHRLDLTEPHRGNAIHGLVAAVDWELVESGAAHAVLAHTITPAPGYPFTLALRAEHRLDEDGLTTTLTATNVGDRPAPYGCAPHPWLLGDDLLRVPAARVLLTDEALLPLKAADVHTTFYDFRDTRPTSGLDVDHAFTGLSAGEVRVGATRITWDPAVLPWVQVCTGAQLGYPGVAVEPMTCPPDAFNSGTDLVRLAPGERHSASWTISAVDDRIASRGK